MNRTPRLSNSDIEYLDKVWNFTSGCRKGCPYCYAEKITKRFNNHYPNGFKPTVYPEALLSPLYLKKPSRIGVCFMGDLFCDCPEFDPERKNILKGFTEDGSSWEDISLKRIIHYVIESCPQHTFLFLTKQPQNLIKFSPFPDNAWTGVTVTNPQMLTNALYGLSRIEAKVKYLSIEPLLQWELLKSTTKFAEALKLTGISWVIIGAQSKPTIMPKIEWVQEIVQACDKAGVKVFLKDSLEPLIKPLMRVPNMSWFGNVFGFRQEMPA